MKVNTETIKAFNPCQDRFDKWLNHYRDKSFSIREFLALDKITHQDKLLVVLRLVDEDTRVIFALDCAFATHAAGASADTAYATAYAAYADDAAAYATYAADAAGLKEEQNRQIESLLYLIGGES